MTMALSADPRYLSDLDVDERYLPSAGSSATQTMTDLREWRLRRDRELVAREVDRLRRLGPDWDGDGGEVPTLMALNHASSVVLDLLGQGVLRPSIVPVTDGGVTVEWHLGRRQLVLYVPPRPGTIEANYLDEATGEEWEGELPFDARLVARQLEGFRAV